MENEETFCVVCENSPLVSLPKGVSVTSGHFTGAAVASCEFCKFVCGLWDCSCELEHDCSEYN